MVAPNPLPTPLASPLGIGASETFVKSVDGESGPTYLFRDGGPREETAVLETVRQLLERYKKSRPFGLNGAAKKLRPVQLALMMLSQVGGAKEGRRCSPILNRRQLLD